MTTTFIPTHWVRDDGGRKAAGFKGAGRAGDCVTRAIAIASELPYKQVHDVITNGNRTQRQTKHTKPKVAIRGADGGVYSRRKWFRDYLQSLGWKWTPTMHIGSGCKVHLRADELPKGRLIVRAAHHYVAVIDGVIHDRFDSSAAWVGPVGAMKRVPGRRCVYGYWSKAT